MSSGTAFFQAPNTASRLKHDIIERYLRPAFTVIGRGTGREILYADLFAGTGQYDDGTPGSPLIAASIAADRMRRSITPRVICFNVELRRSEFEALQINLAGIPQGIVTNRAGDWRKHVGELHELMEERAAIILIDPFELGVDLDDIEDLIKGIGDEPRDLILRLDMQGLQRIVGLKRKDDADYDAAAMTGDDLGLWHKDHFRKANAALGGRWWHRYIEDGELPESAFAPLVAEFCGQLQALGIEKGPRRRTAAVPIPFALGGDTFYYLVLVTRSGKAITLFSDAIEGALSSAWRAKEGAPRDRVLALNLALFDDLAPPADTYAARQAALLRDIADEVAPFVARRPWGATFQEVHEEMADRHLGGFNATHLRQVAKDLQRRGLITIEPGEIRGGARLRAATPQGAVG